MLGTTADVAIASAVAAAAFGLAIGSFLNVVAYRVPRAMSVVRPGSHCPVCATPLSAVDNIPLLSWLALRARCRTCRSPISARYPLVEASTAALFAAGAAAVGPTRALPAVLVLAAIAVAASAISHDGYAVPRSLAGVAVAAVTLLVATAPAGGRAGTAAVSAASALLLVGAGSTAVRHRQSRAGPGVADRGGVAVLAVLTGCAGWFWLPGGLAGALWVATVTLVAAAGQTPSLRRWSMTAASGGAMAAVLVSAALHGP